MPCNTYANFLCSPRETKNTDVPVPAWELMPADEDALHLRHASLSEIKDNGSCQVEDHKPAEHKTSVLDHMSDKEESPSIQTDDDELEGDSLSVHASLSDIPDDGSSQAEDHELAEEGDSRSPQASLSDREESASSQTEDGLEEYSLLVHASLSDRGEDDLTQSDDDEPMEEGDYPLAYALMLGNGQSVGDASQSALLTNSSSPIEVVSTTIRKKDDQG